MYMYSIIMVIGLRTAAWNLAVYIRCGKSTATTAFSLITEDMEEVAAHILVLDCMNQRIIWNGSLL